MSSAKSDRQSVKAAAPGFEAQLWAAADKLRGNMEPSDYKHVALGLIFLKYISDAFEAKHAELQREEFAASGVGMAAFDQTFVDLVEGYFAHLIAGQSRTQGYARLIDQKDLRKIG